MIHLNSYSFKASSLVALALTGILSAGLANAKRVAPPLEKLYSPAQDATALEALNDAQGALDKLDQKLLLAYGDDGVPIIRMERVKHGTQPADLESPSALKTAGGNVLRRIASLEPLTASCGLSSETMHTLLSISSETQTLLEKREIADAATRADWLAQGQQDGSQRLSLVHELNCAPVRKALKEALPSFQTTYAKVITASAQEAELVVEPPVAPSHK
jgi:hypothetical protein